MSDHVADLLVRQGKVLNKDKLTAFLAREKGLNLYYSTKCSLKCPYCVSNMFMARTQSRRTILDELGATEYVKRVRAVAGPERRRVMHGGPGEVMEAEGFRTIMGAFAEEGSEQILQTNGTSLPKHAKFFHSLGEEYMRDRVRFSLSYHLGAYLTKPNGERLRRRFINECVPVIAKYGCRIQIITPLTPAVLADDNYAKEVLALQALFPEGQCKIKCMELGHIFEKKRYPQSYTKAESLRVKELMAEVGSTRKLVDTPELVRFMGPKLRLKGMPCYIRLRVIKVGINGDVFFCTRNRLDTVGNLRNPEAFNAANFSQRILCPHGICSCKGMAYSNALGLHDITPEEYYVAYWKAAHGIDIHTEAGRKSAEHLIAADGAAVPPGWGDDDDA